MSDNVDDRDDFATTDGIPRLRYDLVADLRIRHPDLPLRYTLRSTHDTTVYLHGWQFDQRPYQFLSVVSDDFGAFERSLDTDPTVHDPACIDSDDDRRVYRVSIDDPKQPLAPLVDTGALVHSVSSQYDGWLVRTHIQSRDAIADVLNCWRQADITVAVVKLASQDTVAETSQFGLSDGQHDMLLTAFQEGYFEVPRGISQTDLASRFDISPSAASTRLRRAINRLIETSIASESETASWSHQGDWLEMGK